MVNGIKVNAILSSGNEASDQFVSIALNEAYSLKLMPEQEHVLLVHKAFFVIKAKAKLKRLKDYKYFNNLIHSISGLL